MPIRLCEMGMLYYTFFRCWFDFRPLFDKTLRVSNGQFRFRKNDQIGAADAEVDEYLTSCFVDTGDLSLLANISDRRQILLGRTGSGKTALLARLQEVRGEHVIKISPDNLALTYVSNSTILNFFSGLGVNLDPFFKLLWRHVFTVEILGDYFRKQGMDKGRSVIDAIKAMFAGNSLRDKQMKEALDYLEQWGSKFWQETEYRVKEITSKLEGELDAGLSAKLGTTNTGISASTNVTGRLTQSQLTELRSYGQNIISKAQVQDLSKVITLLDTVLGDRQKLYYIVIDGLDENWVEERLRYKLIMALILTARDFIKVKNAKVIIALRRDLMDRVFRLTRDSGFQEEKYQSLYLPLTWSKSDLIQVLDRRINALVSRRYSRGKVTHRDFLPKNFNKVLITDYIFKLARRPRDIIAFFNVCITVAHNQSRLGAKELKIAEGEYSRVRLRALGDEWSADFPSLVDMTKILQRRPASFKISSIQDKEVDDLCLEVSVKNPGGQGVLQQHAMNTVDCLSTAHDFKIFLMRVFYRIGLIGLKVQPYEAESWADEFGKSFPAPEITGDTSVVIHPTYYRALGTKP